MSDYDTRRPARTGPNMSGTGVAAIVVTVVAVVVGYFVLRSVNDSSVGQAAGAGSSGQSAATSTPDTTALAGPSTTLAPTTFAGAKVVVANANGTSGSAGKATELLKQVTDFEMADPKDAVKKDLKTSIVYYDPATEVTSRPVAENLGRMLGAKPVQPLPEGELVSGGLGGATVVLMLGTDLQDINQNNLVPPLKAQDSAGAPAAPGDSTAPGGATNPTTTAAGQ